jgi:hypothetical protein
MFAADELGGRNVVFAEQDAKRGVAYANGDLNFVDNSELSGDFWGQR